VHLARVIFTGPTRRRARFQLSAGNGIVRFAILLDFTGYILRWDEGIAMGLDRGTNLVKTIPLIEFLVYSFSQAGHNRD